MICSADGCDRPSKGKGCARGYCAMHYMRWLKHGDATVSLTDRQSKHKICTVEGCDKPHSSKGFCQKHYLRLKNNGDALATSDRYRRGIRWIEKNVLYQGNNCLKWPFSTASQGRGTVQVSGKNYAASRYMCILAHGNPPDQSYHAAHTCGKGHEGCMNPRHLAWKTPKENQADKLIHGTLRRGTAIHTNKLTEDDVRQIRKMIGKVSGVEIAKAWGITPTMVSRIKLGHAWAWLE